MREIKFRQWISRYERMHYDIGIVKEGHWAGPSNVTFSENPLMQFTGFLDKNGKEIWEGDIVYKEILSKDDPALDGKYGDRGIVQWGKDGFIVKGDVGRWYDYMGCKFDWVECEVIGNIYMNPEMLPQDMVTK